MDIQLPQILFQIINFGVVAGALTFLMFKPIKKMLEERASRVAEAQQAAEKMLAEKTAMEEMKRAAQKEAEKKAQQTMEAVEHDAQERGREIIAKARKDAELEAEKIIELAKAEKAAMFRQLKDQYAEAVIATASKVIGNIEKKAQSKLIDEELETLLAKI